MRILGWTIIGSFILWLLLTLFSMGNPWQNWQAATQTNWEEDFTMYPVFWLDDHQDLTFNLPANAEQVRLMFTPVAGLAVDQYNVDYQVIGSNGNIISQAKRTFNHDDDIAVLVEDELPDRFFDRPDGLRARFTTDFFIDNDSEEAIHSIKLRLSAPNNSRVAVRLSVLERKNDRDLPILWQRMQREKRVQLLAENIYPTDLISETQRRTVLKYSWLPLGPEGLAGEDYLTSIVFIRKDILYKPDGDFAIANLHMLANTDKVVTFINSAEIGIAGFSCLPINGQNIQWLSVLSQDQKIPERISVQRYSEQELQQVIAVSTENKLYQVTSASNCVVQLYDNAGDIIDISPEVLRGYQVTNEQSLSYALASEENNLQPIKLSVRGLKLAEQASQSTQSTNSTLESASRVLTWKVFSKDNQQLLSGTLNVNEKTDKYEQLTDSQKENSDTLFAASDHYIVAPAGGVRLEITVAGASVLVNAATRPLMLAYTQKVNQTEDFPQWFSLLPINHNELKANAGSRLIYRQTRPLNYYLPTNDVSKQWQSLQSVESLPVYSLFISDPKGQYQALKSLSQTIEFARSERNNVKPRLIYRQSVDQGVKPITIKLDGKPYQYWLTAQAGRLTLPEVTAGSHLLEIIDPDNNEWFIDQSLNTANADQNSLAEKRGRIRQTYPLEKTLSFDVEKSTDNEWLSFYYFPSTNEAHQIEVNVEHTYLSGKAFGHTVPIRRFTIPATNQKSEAVMLNQQKAKLWQGYVLKFPLRHDLPIATYRLHLKTSKVNSGYIQASYIQDNMSHSVEYYQESGNAQ